MINDPVGMTVTQFTEQQIQDRLDASRDDIRYLRLKEAPSIVNTASTNNQAQFVFADYYADFGWWESDVTLQGDLSGNFWKVITPAASDYITGHFQFQLTPFVNGTSPGQLPPVFATGKIYDCNAAAADLLEFWAARLASKYDVKVGGNELSRSQLMQSKLTMSQYYRRQAKPKTAKMRRDDTNNRDLLTRGLDGIY